MKSFQVSVIIPTYNRARLVAECVQSVLHSGTPDIEVIVVDDGSTDDTSNGISELAPNVRYVRQTNAGPAAARNRGFAASLGRYVAFLDSDDRWLPGGAASLVAVLNRHPDVPLIFGDALEGNAQTGYRSFVRTFGYDGFRAIPQIQLEPGAVQLDRRKLFRQELERNAVFLGSLMIRRDVFANLTPYGFDPSLCGAADWELFLRLAARHPYVFVNTSVAEHVWHTQNMSADAEAMEQDFIAALQQLQASIELSAENRALVRSKLDRHLFEAGYRAYASGNLSLARTRFAECGTWKGAGYRLLSHLPPIAVTWARSTKRALCE